VTVTLSLLLFRMHSLEMLSLVLFNNTFDLEKKKKKKKKL
jgi:hypothetical protein